MVPKELWLLNCIMLFFAVVASAGHGAMVDALVMSSLFYANFIMFKRKVDQDNERHG